MTEPMMIFEMLVLTVVTVFLNRQISGLRTLVDQQNVIMQSILLKQKKIETSCQEIAMVDAAIRSQYQNICEAYDKISAEHKKLLGAWKDIYEEYSDSKTCYESLVTNLDGVGGTVEDISEKLLGLGHQFTELNETLKQADISFGFDGDTSHGGDQKAAEDIHYIVTGVDTSPPRFCPDFKRTQDADIITAPGDPDPSADRFVDLGYMPIKAYLEDDDG